MWRHDKTTRHARIKKNSLEEADVFGGCCVTLAGERKEVSWCNRVLESNLEVSLLNIWFALPSYAVRPGMLLLVACLVQFCCVG